MKNYLAIAASLVGDEKAYKSYKVMAEAMPDWVNMSIHGDYAKYELARNKEGIVTLEKFPK